MRWVGFVLIVVATTMIGYEAGLEHQIHLDNLQILKQILQMLSSEIRYTKSPLYEAFSHIGKRMEPPFDTWLCTLAKKLEERSGTAFLKLWSRSIDVSLKGVKLSRDDIRELKRFGRYLGYLDEEMQIGNIELYKERLEHKISELREGIMTKRKLCNCLGAMSGIFLAIILM